jgi:ABC-2 type transport system permease protein
VPAAGGFLLKAVGTAVGAPGWVVGLSPFSHLAPVPLRPPNLTAAGVLAAVSAALAVAGARAYGRRDLLG